MTTQVPRSLLAVLASALAIALLNACVPCHYRATPAVSGQVVSLGHARPVAGATVSMVSRGELGAVQTRTDPAGRFSLPPVERWVMVAIPSDGFSRPEGTLRVEAAGYRPFVQPKVGAFSLTPRQVRPPPGEDEVQHLTITLTPRA